MRGGTSSTNWNTSSCPWHTVALGRPTTVSRHNAEPIQMFEQMLSLRLRAAKSEETDVFTFAVQFLNGYLTTYLIIIIMIIIIIIIQYNTYNNTFNLELFKIFKDQNHTKGHISLLRSLMQMWQQICVSMLNAVLTKMYFEINRVIRLESFGLLNYPPATVTSWIIWS